MKVKNKNEVARSTGIVKTYHRGNLAIQREVFAIPVIVAKAAMKKLDCRLGTYWQANLATPTRRAVRAGLPTVAIVTAGFTTGEFANLLASLGCSLTYSDG